MKTWSPVLAALLLSSTPALALTPEETWAAFQAAATGTGQEMTAAATARAGDTFTATDVAMTVTTPDGFSMVSTLPTLAFRDRGDGTVEVIYPANFTSALTFPDGQPTDPKTLTLMFVHDGLSVIASGTPEALGYEASARALTGTVTEAKDASGAAVDLTGVLSLTGMAAKYATPQGIPGFGYDSTLTADTLAISAKGTGANGNSFDATLSVSALSSRGLTVITDPVMMQDNLAAALAAGTMVDTELSTGPVVLSVKGAGDGSEGGVDATFTSTSAKVKLDKTRLDYGFAVMGGNMVARGMDMPFPEVASTFGEIALGFAMPVTPSDNPQDFSVLTRFVDLTLTEDVWAMFDPGAQLPRDPVSLIVDLKGTGAWTVDILDPAAQMESGPDLPAKLFTLDIGEALVRAAGAQIVGVGGLTFDNANLDALGGFPAPTGKVTFTLTGINALLDALVAIGLVPEQELMSVRMGLAMMAKPGAGPDELISEVEFRAGSLFVNGQQMF
jgi:hypothetical protein